jgi:tetratricopeptide (TPR) repeat protein
MALQLRHLTASVTLLLVMATAAAAQGRAMGTVRDTAGKPIKGATIKATNPDASPSQFASATDDKGRWAMIGLRSGTWHFTVEAPGYFAVETNAPIRVAAAPPMQFALAKDPGPIPNALDRNIQQLIQDAASLRDAGRLDQAIAAYQEIRTKNPKLTSVNLVIGDLYRRKATQETDAGARQNLYRQALDAYDQILKSDATNERALSESAAIRASAR